MGKTVVTVKLDNTKEVSAMAKEALSRALEWIGLEAEGYAKMECPVDTGNLRNSITHTTDESAAYIGTNVEYAPYVELGTSKMKKRPYLKPAATEHTDKYKAIVEKCMKNA